MTALRPRPGRIVPRVRLLFDASLRDRCSERSCCLGLRGISRHVVLRGESVAPGRKVCDCIVLHDAAVPRIVFVELKSGLFHIGQVLEKFTNALDWLSGAEESIFGKATIEPLSCCCTSGASRRRTIPPCATTASGWGAGSTRSGCYVAASSSPPCTKEWARGKGGHAMVSTKAALGVGCDNMRTPGPPALPSRPTAGAAAAVPQPCRRATGRGAPLSGGTFHALPRRTTAFTP